jgi:RHS repeat-associated protein
MKSPRLEGRAKNVTYDKNGNTTTNSAGNDYRYDFENRLINFNNRGAVIIYDGDGNRVKKEADAVTTLYLVDTHNPSGYAQVLEELTVTGSTTNLARAYTYGLNLISQRASDGTVRFYGYDGHGSTRFLTSTNGTITDTYAYDAFGSMIASTVATANVYLYCGEQFDPNLGFYYQRARYMNPSTGRFWTRDTWEGSQEDPLSLHKYLYCEDNPADGIDPSGNDFELASILEGIGGLGIIGAQINAVSAQAATAIRPYKAVRDLSSAVLVPDLTHVKARFTWRILDQHDRPFPSGVRVVEKLALADHSGIQPFGLEIGYKDTDSDGEVTDVYGALFWWHTATSYAGLDQTLVIGRWTAFMYSQLRADGRVLGGRYTTFH